MKERYKHCKLCLHYKLFTTQHCLVQLSWTAVLALPQPGDRCIQHTIYFLPGRKCPFSHALSCNGLPSLKLIRSTHRHYLLGVSDVNYRRQRLTDNRKWHSVHSENKRKLEMKVLFKSGCSVSCRWLNN